MSDEPKRELLPGEAEADAWIDTLDARADAMSDDIVERLRAHLASDHKRGCGGRCYSCDCGYDNSTEGLLAKAADEIERLTAENARLVSICNGTVWEDNERLLEENRKLRATLSQQYATTTSLLRSDQMP